MSGEPRIGNDSASKTAPVGQDQPAADERAKVRKWAPWGYQSVSHVNEANQPAPSMLKKSVYGIYGFGAKALGALMRGGLRAATILDDSLTSIIQRRKNGGGKDLGEVKQGLERLSKEVRPSTLNLLHEQVDGGYFPNGIPKEQLSLYTNPRLVVVKGGATNPYGHALLAFGDPTSGTDRYMQVSSLNWYPEHLDSVAFGNYKQRWGNAPAYEVKIPCKNITKMQQKINDLSKRKWQWGGAKHNCLSLCLEIMEAGGSDLKELRERVNFDTNRVIEVANGVKSGVGAVFINLKEKYSGDDERVTALNKLEDRLFKQVDVYLDNFDGPYDWNKLNLILKHVMQSVEEVIDKECPQWLRLDDQFKDLESVCKVSAWQNVERGMEDFLLHNFREHMDLPLATVYNMPIEDRVVGPQSLAEFDSDPEVGDDLYAVNFVQGMIEGIDSAVENFCRHFPHHAEYKMLLIMELRRLVYELDSSERDQFVNKYDPETNTAVSALDNVLSTMFSRLNAFFDENRLGFLKAEFGRHGNALKRACEEKIYDRASKPLPEMMKYKNKMYSIAFKQINISLDQLREKLSFISLEKLDRAIKHEMDSFFKSIGDDEFSAVSFERVYNEIATRIKRDHRLGLDEVDLHMVLGMIKENWPSLSFEKKTKSGREQDL